MEITNRNIKEILEKHMPRGVWVHVSDIQGLIATHYPLTNGDWAPHTKTRPTRYPRWKHKVQSVLAQMKIKGEIEHDRDNNSYKM